jgi:hypothetical protein
MMKSYVDYLTGKKCGILFKAEFIDKCIESTPSDAMREGIYFEYLATGSLPRTGEVPEPDRTAKGELTSPYKRVKEAAEFFREIIAHHNIFIKRTGYVISTSEMTGIIDIWADWNGEDVIIDTKYSGLIDDKWNELGWETESLTMKDTLMIQGVHYKMLAKEALGKDVPFYYFIFNSKDPRDMKIIRQEVDEDKFFFHKENVKKMRAAIQTDIEQGFKAYPDYRKCKDCPLFDSCSHAHKYPQIIPVYY